MTFIARAGAFVLTNKLATLPSPTRHPKYLCVAMKAIQC